MTVTARPLHPAIARLPEVRDGQELLRLAVDGTLTTGEVARLAAHGYTKELAGNASVTGARATLVWDALLLAWGRPTDPAPVPRVVESAEWFVRRGERPPGAMLRRLRIEAAGGQIRPAPAGGSARSAPAVRLLLLPEAGMSAGWMRQTFAIAAYAVRMHAADRFATHPTADAAFWATMRADEPDPLYVQAVLAAQAAHAPAMADPAARAGAAVHGDANVLQWMLRTLSPDARGAAVRALIATRPPDVVFDALDRLPRSARAGLDRRDLRPLLTAFPDRRREVAALLTALPAGSPVPIGR